MFREQIEGKHVSAPSAPLDIPSPVGPNSKGKAWPEL
jgi:hypothetical protein